MSRERTFAESELLSSVSFPQIATHVVAVVFALAMFKIVFDGGQSVPTVIFGVVFILVLCLTTFHINRQVYVRISNNNMVNLTGILKQKIVHLRDIEDVKRVWVDAYRFKVYGKVYVFYAFKQDAKFFCDAVQKSKQ